MRVHRIIRSMPECDCFPFQDIAVLTRNFSFSEHMQKWSCMLISGLIIFLDTPAERNVYYPYCSVYLQLCAACFTVGNLLAPVGSFKVCKLACQVKKVRNPDGVASRNIRFRKDCFEIRPGRRDGSRPIMIFG